MTNIMRWLSVAPGSILAAVLSTFPLHILLYQTLTGSGLIEPYPQTPERFLGPLAAALALVWAGSRIAPSHHTETAVVLFGLLLLLLGAGFALGLTGTRIGSSQISLQLGGLAPAGAVIGAFIGLYLARRNTSAKGGHAGQGSLSGT